MYSRDALLGAILFLSIYLTGTAVFAQEVRLSGGFLWPSESNGETFSLADYDADFIVSLVSRKANQVSLVFGYSRFAHEVSVWNTPIRSEQRICRNLNAVQVGTEWRHSLTSNLFAELGIAPSLLFYKEDNQSRSSTRVTLAGRGAIGYTVPVGKRRLSLGAYGRYLTGSIPVGHFEGSSRIQSEARVYSRSVGLSAWFKI